MDWTSHTIHSALNVNNPAWGHTPSSETFPALWFYYERDETMTFFLFTQYGWWAFTLKKNKKKKKASFWQLLLLPQNSFLLLPYHVHKRWKIFLFPAITYWGMMCRKKVKIQQERRKWKWYAGLYVSLCKKTPNIWEFLIWSSGVFIAVAI